MRCSSNHVMTTLVPEVVEEDALLNETAEIERRALEERRTSPRYVRGKEVRRRGYARYRFLRGFRVSLLGVVYGLEWVTVRLPVLYRGEGEDWSGGVAQGGEAGAQGPPPALLRVGREVERQALDPGAGGEGGLQVRGRGREVREVEGRKEGGAPDRVGTHGGRCEGSAVVLTWGEDVVSYWDLPVRLWRYNLTLVVADGVKALDEAISRSGIQVARQTCPVHLKRSRRVRDALDLLLSLAVPTRVSPLLSYLLAPRELWPLLRSNDPTSPSTPSRRVRQVPLPLEDRIAWALAINYNLSTCYLIIVIILQDPLFLREMIKYIQ
ncbi:hypothetical protein MetMK1DRAFT_00004890 [Metallosphaera yellowstonensis MK1]|uniref:Uncharacterized protein n=1 Tax=Metallosphaera yellowstonensis MK1 TaxID=671065 RepID=H2C166_9CREN|nr:hypothetical protein MetMK1DRAFT_00004890 [Metallosphaera yellowstonensis MK1]